ncbi:MAG: ATP-binding cassette domain-containing protein [Clostridiales bacterium]|nr:ATP-binding cassette domain-containing protein [Clostridiales bacterium]MBR6254913.1 ATP-binding cassette domain-containing protein [Clostridiales bacterium]MCR5274044.1 ATP-binding cassette domain-containing protein [Clostridiales bacterium]
MSLILETDKITKMYKDKTAVNQVSIHVERGEVYGLIGRNGAGKTTLLKMIANLAQPTSGTFTIHGANGETQAQMRSKIGVLIEDPGVFQNLNAFQNLKAKAIAAGIKNDEYLKELLAFVGLANVGKKSVKNFSLGMRQRLGIAIAMVNSPELLLLDEPINGLDPQGIAEVRGLIHRLCKERGISVIISSHILEELSKVADRYGIIHEGVLLDEATNEELLSRCKPRLFLRTSDNEAARAALIEMDIEDYTIFEDHVEIRERVNESGAISMRLAQKGIQTLEMRTEGNSLEDYYFRLTGGVRNV